ncbi:MAG: PepSY domain-containing protein [Thermaceae bacterium]|nr:PepSY domain-containing protein [Thermaceae bacterium]
MIKSTKPLKALALGAVAAISLGAAISFAQQSGTQSPSYKGSIPVQEGQNYASLAKVSMQDAVKAAQSAIGSTASPTTVKLGNENGYLVWEVVIGGQEIKVDAGNAQILDKQAANGAEENDGESQGEGNSDGENSGN